MGDKEPQPSIEVVIHAPTQRHRDGHQATLPERCLPSILTRLHAGYFRITLSLGCQALLWKTLSESPANNSMASHNKLHLFPSFTFQLIWCLALVVLLLLSLLYTLRCIFRFHMIEAEFLHPLGVNYLFAPWISWLLLLQSAPLIAPDAIYYQVIWWVFVLPIMALDVKIYGQWFTAEKRFLSMLANPTSQISVIGNLVGARGAAQMGWKECALCLFSLGMVHYLVLFITLYQRLSGSNRIPARLRPVFFLFVAAPSMASLAWTSICGSFDILSKILFFLALFLFMSLACRPTFFKKSVRKFNVAWWAYSFPLTLLALASTEYAQEVKMFIPSGLMLILSAISVLVFVGIMFFAALNADQALPEDDPILNFGNNLGSRA